MTDPINPANELNEARTRLLEAYANELAACDGLLVAGLNIARRWPGRPLHLEDNAHDLLVLVLYTRALDTYWASVELARTGLGDQAAMLNRALFEAMVDIHWVRVEPERATTLFTDHHTHSRMLLADQVAKYPDLYAGIELPEFDQAERDRLDRLFTPYGSKSWTTLNLHDRVTAIEGQWLTEQDRHYLRFFRDIPHAENNRLLHPTALGLQAVVVERSDEQVTLRVGPAEDMVKRALFGAAWNFWQIVGLMLDHFEIPMSDADRAALLPLDAFSRQSA